ncbi:transmembrane protease serine 2-like [Tropilaelaps mercedesae]|uniref:Transmembrane protease serine 2-like n=1 Tax=Tropilaelaps mercedesae TaxID=418985 RepID=A0A1V9WZI4_9ACAR|nr:transmembrane protease serine 2-like [Tropilaelaps mercedesae]
MASSNSGPVVDHAIFNLGKRPSCVNRALSMAFWVIGLAVMGKNLSVAKLSDALSISATRVSLKWLVIFVWVILCTQSTLVSTSFLKPGCMRKGFTMCGTRLVHPSAPSRIIGGRDALPGELPFQVALYRKMSKPVYYASGSLLTDRHVLTCGHCLEGLNKSEVTIWVGVHRKSLPALISRGRMQTDGMFFVHPAFDRRSLANDIGIIRLRQRIVLDGFVNSICLPSKGLRAAEMVFVSGYGYIDANGPASDFLKIVQLDLIPPFRCIELLPGFNVNPNTSLCTLTENKDACLGDSGGPLFQQVRGRFVQFGVVSWGRACALRNSPGVYVNVAAYLDWIFGIIDLG